jgi:superfamily I DNA/RNA helicase
VRANLSGTSDAELNELADHYGVEVNGDSETIFAAVAATLDRCNRITTTVDLDEQLYFPVKFNLPVTQYDVVVADEAQDLTKCQAALLLKMVKPGGVIVAVGDTWQSIYGFRGAGIHALEDLKENLGAEELPLSITYRCCIEVVNLITSKFPDTGLEAAPWAKQGAITHMSSERALLEYSPADMILCRTNAPLVEPCFALIRKGIKATIRGREIGTGLIMMIRKMKAADMVDLLAKLNEYSKAEVTKLEAAEKTSQAQVLKDKVETIVALTDGCGSITELEDKIESIFSDDKVGVVFSSIHKAKGLEAERVFILHPELLPHPMAKQGWEKEQERHLEYVAITRAKSELVYVEG